MKSIKINFKSQLQNWNDFFVLTIIFLVIIIFLYYRDGFNIGFISFYAFLAIQFSFTFYLHIAYYLRNRGEEFIIKNDRIIRIKNGKEELFLSSDIKKIVICKSANQDKWGIPYTTFESFRIARVYLNNNTIFIMTNLLEFDIEKPLQVLHGVKFERKKGFSFFI
jgi:hypothetical protein